MKRLFFVLALVLPFMAGAQSLTVHHLSETHTLIQVSGNDRYVMLPVQETAQEASVKVLSNGNVVLRANISLAIDKTDYLVPLDLGKWGGSSILLDVTMTQGRGVRRDPSDDVCWSEMVTVPVVDHANKEKQYRPTYHFSPEWGWMNDPNGMVYKDGEWHLFYQYNPYGSFWGNMHWGHAVSKDLVNWEHLGIALAPDDLGAIFSGSAVVDTDNTAGFGRGAIVAMYTSDGSNQTQSIAYSLDNGRTFTKYSGNPVIMAEDTPDFRDPKVFWDHQTRQWKVVLAAGQEVQFYSSPNLKDWTYDSSFGLAYGNHNGVWECPDLIRLPFEGKDKWVLLLNINPGGPFGGSATQYFVGDFDGHKFTCESMPKVTKWLDYGKDHYATVSFSNAPDGRTVVLAWMSNWQYANQVPTRQFRSANSIARDLGLFKDGEETYVSVIPSKETLAMRGKKIKNPTDACEIVVDVKGSMELILSNTKGEQVVMKYDAQKQTFAMNRKQSGDISFSEAFPIETTAPTHGALKQLRLFIDHSSIEAFASDGKMAMTNLVFPNEPYNTLKVKGGKATIYEIK